MTNTSYMVSSGSSHLWALDTKRVGSIHQLIQVTCTGIEWVEPSVGCLRQNGLGLAQHEIDQNELCLCLAQQE